MMYRRLGLICILGTGVVFGVFALMPARARLESSSGLVFRHHFIDAALPAPQELIGFGETALADLDGDGDLDFVVGQRGGDDVLYWYEFQAPERWVRHTLGSRHGSDVGAAALDVDGDGWIDVVGSGVWFRNPGKPREKEFTPYVFDGQATGAHDVLATDLDGDGKKDILLMGDENTKLNSLRWYRVAPEPTQTWTMHRIGPAVHGAITPSGVGDVDGDGDLDVVRADTWFENANGQGTRWLARKNIPFGRTGPYGMCVRCIIVDINGDRREELVMVDTDIEGSKAVILKNVDGKGNKWEKLELPQSFPYGSLHSLAVADFDRDGDLDILVNEQEELLPQGRQNPRWVIWENLGGDRFAERIVLDQRLGGHELVVGDVDGDGDIDICSKPWTPQPWNGNHGRMHVDFLENLNKR